MLDEAEIEDGDAAEPIDMLESYFSAHGWVYRREEDEIIARVKGSWTEYELRAIWREEDAVLQFLAFPEVRVAEERRASVYEALGLINEQLWIGHFELWSQSGILLFRHAAMIGADESATPLFEANDGPVPERVRPLGLTDGGRTRGQRAARLLDRQGRLRLDPVGERAQVEALRVRPGRPRSPDQARRPDAPGLARRERNGLRLAQRDDAAVGEEKV